MKCNQKNAEKLTTLKVLIFASSYFLIENGLISSTFPLLLSHSPRLFSRDLIFAKIYFRYLDDIRDIREKKFPQMNWGLILLQ